MKDALFEFIRGAEFKGSIETDSQNLFLVHGQVQKA